MSITFDELAESTAKMKVIGVGGSGGNAINTMIHFGLEGVEFVTVNTDAQALSSNAAVEKIAIGQNVTRGLGAGVDDVSCRVEPFRDLQRERSPRLLVIRHVRHVELPATGSSQRTFRPMLRATRFSTCHHTTTRCGGWHNQMAILISTLLCSAR